MVERLSTYALWLPTRRCRHFLSTAPSRRLWPNSQIRSPTSLDHTTFKPTRSSRGESLFTTRLFENVTDKTAGSIHLWRHASSITRRQMTASQALFQHGGGECQVTSVALLCSWPVLLAIMSTALGFLWTAVHTACNFEICNSQSTNIFSTLIFLLRI